MKVVVTGQVGLDKRQFLERVAARATSQGFDTKCAHVGQRMYAETPGVQKGKILDLPIGQLEAIRRSAFKDILREAETAPSLIVNTHATFRWNHGLFFAFDYDHMTELDADLYIVLLDNIDQIYRRLVRDGHTDFSLKDLMVWREEEIMATEMLSRIVRRRGHFYICVRGDKDEHVETVVRLMHRPQMKKVYLSFPMSHVMDLPDVQAEIDAFRAQMKQWFVCFDPADMESEKPLTFAAVDAAKAGHRKITTGQGEQQVTLDVQEFIGIIPDIDGQIYVRDFMLIDQSDMIVSLVPAMPGGKPAISSGVERELHHAHETGRDVFVIWQPECEPSPFITETCTKIFRSSQEALDFFQDNGYAHEPTSGPLFE